MDALEIIEERLFEMNILIDWYCVKNLSGYIRIEEGKDPYIAVNPKLARTKKIAVAYHEAGHLFEGLNFTPGKNENKAISWAAGNLFKIEDLVKAIKQGAKTTYEVASIANIDEEFLLNFLKLLSLKYEYYLYGDYILKFNPIILYNRKSGHIWPDEAIHN